MKLMKILPMLLIGLLAFSVTCSAATIDLSLTKAEINEEPVTMVAGSFDILDPYIDVTVTMGSGSGRPGDTIAVPITISDIGLREVFGIDLVLIYDEALLEATKVIKSGLTTDWSLQANVGVAGEVRIALYHTAVLVGGGGELCRIIFGVK